MLNITKLFSYQLLFSNLIKKKEADWIELSKRLAIRMVFAE